MKTYAEEFGEILDGSEESLPGIELGLRLDVARIVAEHVDSTSATQRMIATDAGLDAGKISRIMSGEENLTLKTISKLFRAMGKKPRIVEDRMPQFNVVGNTVQATNLYTTSSVAGTIQ